ncbi:low temperature requirement protein A [Candidatus Leptofilum sp.]|uniref:low temperature requirement protein A n=1 Tax=Candidatus Leptofilum sp. TaxID=3241576 RepID=UPI003B5CF143
MNTIRQNFRQWWQPPRRLADREEDRSVTFLELFYDLVYVVIVAELAHALAGDISWAGVGRFAFLFIVVWWAWWNGTSYHDLHGNNDIRTRVFTFLQMGTVAAMAVFAHNAMGEGSTGFALSYAAFQFILLYLWWRSGVHDPAHRPLSQPFVAGYLLTTLLFVGSVFFAEPVRFYLWGAALLLSLLLPATMFMVGRDDPEIQAQIDLSTAVSPSLVERFGLFTIIVLGEVIVGTVGGLAEHHHLDFQVGLTGALGMLIAVGLWWLYFDFISHHKPLPSRNMVFAWFYLHLPMTIGIVGVGAAVLNIVEHAGEHLPGEARWLLVGALALVLVTITLLMHTIQYPNENRRIYNAGGWSALISAVVIALLGITNLEIMPLLIIVILLLLAPVFYSFRVWIEMLGAEEIPLS